VVFGDVGDPQPIWLLFEDGDSIFQFPDALRGRAEVGLLAAAQAGFLAGVDQLLLAPGVDGLVADSHIGRELRDGAADGHQIQHLAAGFSG
jgi:hypothetical protein